jgi:hypothetical protein
VTKERATVRDLARQVLELRQAVDSVRFGARLTIIGSAAAAAAVTSKSPLGVNLQQSFTTLTATEEVNTTATSFSPFIPVISGNSTSSPTIGGIYDGSQGDDTLTFKIKKGGDVGSKGIDVEVRDGQGVKLETIKFKKTDPPGTMKTLKNGLTLTLSAGVAEKNDTFTVDVFATVGSAVDPDKPFNGSGNDNPNFELGQSVTAGSFTINGRQIEVLASDTLNSVVSKITNTNAGVVATFDAATERVLLTQKTLGSGGQIVLGGDSSGFFDAVKLSAATPVTGTDSDLDIAVSQVSQLAGISDGTFTINSVVLTVDTSVDTLSDIIGRINASSAGVTATFDQARNKLDIVATDAEDSFELEAGTSGFFVGVEIASGLYQGKAAVSPGSKFVDADKFPGVVKDFGETLQTLFGSEFSPYALGSADRTLRRIESAIRDAFASIQDDTSGDRFQSGLGIDFDFRDGARFLVLDTTRLTLALSRDPEGLAEFLLSDAGSGGNEGLLVVVERALEEPGDDLALRFDPVAKQGLIVNLTA